MEKVGFSLMRTMLQKVRGSFIEAKADQLKQNSIHQLLLELLEETTSECAVLIPCPPGKARGRRGVPTNDRDEYALRIWQGRR